jgi:hypothetical protein
LTLVVFVTEAKVHRVERQNVTGVDIYRDHFQISPCVIEPPVQGSFIILGTVWSGRHRRYQ